MNECYLLRYKSQTTAFRQQYAAFIAKNHDPFLDWWGRLPLYEWTPLPFNSRTMAAGIGLLCLLYIDGEINLTFDKTVTLVQRNALTPEEYQEWADKHFKHIEHGTQSKH